ncbi:MAG: phospholipase D-like domain-containing protein, partial [Gammaproteobacteria bacterium]
MSEKREVTASDVIRGCRLSRLISRLGVWFFGLVILPIGLVYSALTAVLWWGDRQHRSSAPEGSSVYSRSRERHGLELVDDGLVSLRRRLELIDEAESSVELEFFIYQLDLSARLVTERAIAAAKRGVRVRLLVDFAAPVLRLAPGYAMELERRGVEVRYYNTSSLLRVVSSQHRSHRKLLLIDGRKAITGGRNIGDEYFNLAPDYSFRDSDVLVEGPIVQAMRSSFEHYWSSELTDRADAVGRDTDGIDPGFFADPRTLAEVRQDIEQATAAKEATRQRHECRDIAFATDHSGVMSTNRQVFDRLSELLGEARREVVGESPYLVLRPDGMAVLRALHDRGVRQMILTNSLASTDAFYTVAALTFTLSGLEDTGVDVRVYDGS